MLSDSHSIEYDFELQPVIGGVRLDSYFYGTAELANDGEYGFFVKAIWLDGTMPSPFAKGLGRRERKPATVKLDQASPLNSAIEGHLFLLLRDALYEDEAAQEAWAAEREAA